MKEKNDDLYGSVEDSGYEMDTATPTPSRNGINRTQTFLNVMDMVAQPAGPMKPSAKRPNIKSDATKMGDSYD